jgi:hypothetical protein
VVGGADRTQGVSENDLHRESGLQRSAPKALPRSNPFATRYVRPGAVPFLFPDEASTAALVDRLAALQWRAMIVGPHGSGKTSLLECFLPECVRRGREPKRFSLHDQQRRLPEYDRRDWNRQTLVVIDGYEQLAWWPRRQLLRACQRQGCGLLITAHRPGPLPVLYKTEPSLSVVQQLVSQLLPAAEERISAADVCTAYRQHGPNVREVLFALYDLYQSRR